MSDAQEDQSRDIKAQLRSLLEKDASLREKYLDPPTHLSSFIGTEGQHIGLYIQKTTPYL